MSKRNREKNRSAGKIIAQGPDAKLNKLGQVATHASLEATRKITGHTDFVREVREKRKPDEAIGVVDDTGWVRRSLVGNDKGRWDVVGEANEPDPRQVAVQFYLSMLASCVRGGINLMAVANVGGDEFPRYAARESIVHSALHKFEEGAAKPLTEQNKKEFTDLLNSYLGSMFYRLLKDARIFQFKQHDFGALYHIADIYVTAGAGYKWTPGVNYKTVPQHEADEVAKFTINEGIKVPFPEKLPFRSCYFAWGTGIIPSMVQCYQYGLDPQHLNMIMGTLIDSTGWAFTIILKGRKDTVGFAISHQQEVIGGMRQVVVVERIGDAQHQNHVHVDGTPGTHDDRMLNPGWTLPYALAPWIILYAVDSIDANDSLIRVQPGLLKERMQFKALTKRSKQQFVPAPYYTVVIQPTTYEEIETRIKSQPRKWSHQWDVRGHYGHKVMRGTLPMDARLVNDLHKRKYEIFHALHRPTGEVYSVLMRKRVAPPRENEWLAYLRFHRDSFIKGPKDKPYIPSIHRLKRGLPEV